MVLVVRRRGWFSGGGGGPDGPGRVRVRVFADRRRRRRRRPCRSVAGSAVAADVGLDDDVRDRVGPDRPMVAAAGRVWRRSRGRRSGRTVAGQRDRR